MDKKYTTITVSKELSYKIRKFGLENNMKTSEVLEMAVLRLYETDDTTLYETDDTALYEMADIDLGLKPKPKPKAVVKAKPKAVVKARGHVTQKTKIRNKKKPD